MNSSGQASMMLLGIGSGGCRLAASIKQRYAATLNALGVDTDALANRYAEESGLECLLLGGSRLAGYGSGGDIVQGRMAAQDDLANITKRLESMRTVVVITSLGGGTGGGATPEILGTLKTMGITTLCFVTMPFRFEGEGRQKNARRVLPLIESNADTLVQIPLDDLFSSEEYTSTLPDAIDLAEEKLSAAITLFWRFFAKPGFLAMEPELLHNMILQGGNARFGIGSSELHQEGRAAAAVAALCGCKMLRSNGLLVHARALLLGILGGEDLRLAEIGEVMSTIRSTCKSEPYVEMGVVCDPAYAGRIQLITLAFEQWAVAEAEAEEQEDELQTATGLGLPSGGVRSRGARRRLSHGPTGKGRFTDVEATLYNNQDLDVPTYRRKKIRLDR